ncbi:hypothetical protein ABZV67_43865 [Streptomyces sp. NPDC005065]|uniref:hypothetical protein n=1 Tax=unclassified Streptomyces TaxID=2593676 RepID=UPI0033A69283
MVSERSSAPTASTQVTTTTDGVAQIFTWDEDARIEVRDLGGEVVIEPGSTGLTPVDRSSGNEEVPCDLR